jgi:hypothetical protein
MNTNTTKATCPFCDRAFKVRADKNYGPRLARHGHRAGGGRGNPYGCPGSDLLADQLTAHAVERAEFAAARAGQEDRERYWLPMLAKLRLRLS